MLTNTQIVDAARTDIINQQAKGNSVMLKAIENVYVQWATNRENALKALRRMFQDEFSELL